jgi:hypothetical protein
MSFIVVMVQQAQAEGYFRTQIMSHSKRECGKTDCEEIMGCGEGLSANV